jgi:hypothetical protein
VVAASTTTTANPIPMAAGATPPTELVSSLAVDAEMVDPAAGECDDDPAAADAGRV